MLNWIKFINGNMSRNRKKRFRDATCLYKIQMQRKYFLNLVSSEDVLSKTDESRIVCHFFWGLHSCMLGLCDDRSELSGLTEFCEYKFKKQTSKSTNVRLKLTCKESFVSYICNNQKGLYLFGNTIKILILLYVCIKQALENDHCSDWKTAVSGILLTSCQQHKG